ncbi:MAG: type IV pilus twitching motility protein PilT [Candidatus Sumerlaeia bacterium]
MVELSKILAGAIKLGASDIHIVEHEVPYFRIHGELKRLQTSPTSAEDMERYVRELLPTSHLIDTLQQNRGVDASYQLEDTARFRVVVYYQDNALCITMRLIPMAIPTLEELEMPEILKDVALYHRGMVLVTGITGSGKSTTLAAMLNHLNLSEARRIITIEDPIEFRFKRHKCLITQREVGADVPNFPTGLRQSLRADPDVILIGEMRDVETIQTAIKASETGHLVYSTLHTTSALHTIQRIIGYFPQDMHDLIREQVALNLRAAMTQRLVKRCDRPGRIAATELLIVNNVVRKLILDDRILDVQPVIKSRADGMRLMDQSLADHVRNRKVSLEEAQRYCDDFYALKRYIAGIESSGDAGGIIG